MGTPLKGRLSCRIILKYAVLMESVSILNCHASYILKCVRIHIHMLEVSILRSRNKAIIVCVRQILSNITLQIDIESLVVFVFKEARPNHTTEPKITIDREVFFLYNGLSCFIWLFSDLKNAKILLFNVFTE